MEKHNIEFVHIFVQNQIFIFSEVSHYERTLEIKQTTVFVTPNSLQEKRLRIGDDKLNIRTERRGVS